MKFVKSVVAVGLLAVRYLLTFRANSSRYFDMKLTIVTLIVLTLCFAFSAAAQKPTRPAGKASVVRFPGISLFQMTQLREAKKVTSIPLPSWIPEGFKVTQVKLHLGSMVEIQDRVLIIVYSKNLANGKTQRFAIEAGFDGLGGLPYDVTKVISSGVGKIDLMYEPSNEDGKIKNFAMTEWFRVGKAEFHYDGMYDNEPEDKSLTMISLADTVKILKSLQRL